MLSVWAVGWYIKNNEEEDMSQEGGQWSLDIVEETEENPIEWAKDILAGNEALLRSVTIEREQERFKRYAEVKAILMTILHDHHESFLGFERLKDRVIHLRNLSKQYHLNEGERTLFVVIIESLLEKETSDLKKKELELDGITDHYFEVASKIPPSSDSFPEKPVTETIDMDTLKRFAAAEALIVERLALGCAFTRDLGWKASMSADKESILQYSRKYESGESKLLQSDYQRAYDLYTRMLRSITNALADNDKEALLKVKNPITQVKHEL